MPTDDIDDLIDEIYNEVRGPVILPERERERERILVSFIRLFMYSFFLRFGVATKQGRYARCDERD